MEITGNMASQVVKETMGAQLVKQTIGLANKTGTSNQASFDMQTKVLGAAMTLSAPELETVKVDLGKGMNLDIKV